MFGVLLNRVGWILICWPNMNLFEKSNCWYLYSNKQYSETYIRISKYIWIIALHQRQFLIEFEYEYIRKVDFPIFIFEYPIFWDKYLNIRIYSNIRPTLLWNYSASILLDDLVWLIGLNRTVQRYKRVNSPYWKGMKHIFCCLI